MSQVGKEGKVPKVSVVVPVYNGERYLKEALSTVFAQTFSDYEIICVDDGSTDGSLKVLNEFKDQIAIVCQENGGQGAARNTGVRESASPYIAFLDQDDGWYPHKLEQQVAVLDSNPDVVLVHCNEDWVDSNGRMVQHGVTLSNRLALKEAPLTRLVGKEVSFIVPSTMVVRREAFERVGSFDPHLRGAEDIDLCLRLREVGHLVFLEQIGTWYRVHSDGFNRRGGEALLVSGERFYHKLQDFYKHDPSKLNLLSGLFAQLYSDWGMVKVRKGSRWQGLCYLLSSLRYCPIKLRTYSRLARLLLPNFMLGKWKMLKKHDKGKRSAIY